MGPKEACTGLTFVSRAKRLVDLMVEPMSFDRIGNLGNSSTMKARLQEEVKLDPETRTAAAVHRACYNQLATTLQRYRPLGKSHLPTVVAVHLMHHAHCCLRC